jgi:hypothetical protein
MEGLDYYCAGAPTERRRLARERAPVNYREPAIYDIPSEPTPAALARSGSSGAAKSGAAQQSADEAAAEDFDHERERRVVENEATKFAKHWTVNNRGLWARIEGRFRLPQEAARRAARQCALLCSACALLYVTCLPAHGAPQLD